MYTYFLRNKIYIPTSNSVSKQLIVWEFDFERSMNMFCNR